MKIVFACIALFSLANVPLARAADACEPADAVPLSTLSAPIRALAPDATTKAVEDSAYCTRCVDGKKVCAGRIDEIQKQFYPNMCPPCAPVADTELYVCSCN